MQRLLCFQAGGQEFGARLAAVKETLPERPLTRVFLVPPVVAGLMNLRGEVVAVLDLTALCGLPRQSFGDRRRHPETAIVVLRNVEAGKSGRAGCGLHVERLLGVREVDDTLSPPPVTLDPVTAGYLAGVATTSDDVPRPILVLDPERVLGCEQLRPYRRSAA